MSNPFFLDCEIKNINNPKINTNQKIEENKFLLCDIKFKFVTC